MLLAVRLPAPRWARVATGIVLGAVALAALLALRWPFPPVPALAIGGAALSFGAAAVLSLGGRLSRSATATAAGFALLFGLAVPGVNPPALPPDAVPATGGRSLWVYDFSPGLFTLSAGRPVRRAWNVAEAEEALRAGGALIAYEAQVDRLSPEVRGRLVKLARWRRIPGYLPEERAWRSWRDRNPDEIYEWMSIVALPDSTGPTRP
jgi:hypothetical protein